MSVKILFISMITGNKFAGPTYSVPATIKHMTKYADISWLNLDDKYCFKQDENPEVNFASKDSFSSLTYESILGKLGKPDIVIFEDLYNIDYCRISKYLRKNGVPYILVPRGGLCKAAQDKKRLKKFIGNTIYFNRFIHGAQAIHYLTANEQKDSGTKWNKKSFIIPNGVSIPEQTNIIGQNKFVQGTFIGRLDIYHKGIDFLLEAVSKKKELLLNNKIRIKIYGADLNGDSSRINTFIQEHELNDILELLGPVYDDEKDTVLKETDFFILTSRFEGHPTGLLEALSYGIPALVTDGSNMGKEISEWNAGWVSPNSSEGVCESFENMSKSLSSLSKIGQNARMLALEYSWDTICSRIEKELELILE